MSKKNLIGATNEQLEKMMEKRGEQRYRGRQLFKYIYRDNGIDFHDITVLSKELRQKLDDEFAIIPMEPSETLKSEDGTIKYLFTLSDGLGIETVRIPDPESGRVTVCVSSQAGCAVACKFCATGAQGFKRNLTVGEIIGQMMYLRQVFLQDAFSNVVFMGMGEPMLNLETVLKVVGIMTDGAGFSHGAKKITVSTSGIIPGINGLTRSGSKVRLAVSLNAPTQEKRVQIMPISEKYPLDELLVAVKEYAVVTGTRVTFEYALFEGFNDTKQDVKDLARTVRGIPCKINILAYNPVEGLPFGRPTPESVDSFAKQLYPHVPAVTVRKSRGADIQAACGQLAGAIKPRR